MCKKQIPIVDTANIAKVPEPSTLLGLGTIALAGATLLRRKRKA